MKYKRTVNLKRTSNDKHAKKASPASKMSRSELALRQLKRRPMNGTKHLAILKRLYSSMRNNKVLKKVILASIFLFTIVAIVGGIVLFSYLQDVSNHLPSLDDPFGQKELASEILDRNGVLLYKVFNQYNRDEVKIDDIPHYVRLAFIGGEDATFYDHPGFDVTGIASCLLKIIKRTSTICGGSTITQQSLKITSFYKEQGVERKIKEILFALQIERKYNKEEILQLYLTVTPFGSTVTGVTTASNFYFGKKPSELTMAQAIILASIINDPNHLSPTLSTDPKYADEHLMARAQFILKQLREKKDYLNDATRRVTANNADPAKVVKDDVLTDDLLNQAEAELSTVIANKQTYFRPPVATDIKAPHFVAYVQDHLEKGKYKNGEGFTVADLQNGGYKVYTTLDYNLQKTAEAWVTRGYNERVRLTGARNVALMTTKPDTGEILTMVGSRDYNASNEDCKPDGTCKFNPKVNVLTTLQSAGSTMKPLAYYLAYSQGKLFPGSILPDLPVEWGKYKPKNVDSKFNGFSPAGDYSTARNELKLSRNLPALQVIETAGVDNYIQEAQKFGYTTINSQTAGRSVVLGGTDVYLTEHAQAYGVFANGGDLVKLESISKIIDRDGNVVYQAAPKRERVGDPQGIYILNSSMNNMYDDAPRMSWDGRDVAGKTGTTEFKRELLFVMFSPDFVTVAWAGNNDNTSINYGSAFGGTTVRPWVTSYMKEIGGTEYFKNKTRFSRPGGIISGGGPCDPADKTCTKANGLVAGLMIQGKTPAPDQEYYYVRVCVDEQDHIARPIDESTGNAMDRRYVIYKAPTPYLQSWWDKFLDSHGFPTSIATAPCDINRNPSGGTNPWSVLTTPVAGATITGANINIKGNAYSAVGNVTDVEFFLDNNLLGTSTTAAFDVSYPIPANLDNGSYDLKVLTHDSTGKTGTQVIRIIIGGATTGNLVIVTPTGTVNYDGTTPIVVTANYTGPATLGPIDLYASKDGGAFVKLGTMTANTFNWSPLHEDADYVLYLKASANNTGILQSQNYPVKIKKV